MSISLRNYNNKGTLSTFIASCILIATAQILFTNRQYIIDQLIVWQYQPTSGVISLANRTGMSDRGRFLFFASQPKLDATQNFNTECNLVETTISILGCYSDYIIFIYDITDTQLDGIREVTAAHETLHAAYLRLSDGEKNKLNPLLEAEYKKLESDKDFADLISFYASSEPGQRDNELHSLIGTSVADISPELEAHYSKYFSDRQKTVALNEKYSSVFQKLQDRADEITAQLNSLESDITNSVKQYNTDVTALNNDVATFNSHSSSGYFSSHAQFNSERSALMSRVAVLDQTRENINGNIKIYDSLLTEYNSIASQSKKLNNSIDSTLAPAPSV